MAKKGIFVIWIIFLLLIFFNKIIFSDQIFFYDQILSYFYPILTFSHNILKQGEIPLWDPYLFSGRPFAANMITGSFYPLKWLFYPFSLPVAFKMFIIIHFFLSALFFYLLMRDLKVSKTASFLSTIAWTFSGYSVSHIQFSPCIATITWIPLIFLLTNRIIYRIGQSSNSLNYSIILYGMVLALQILAGYIPLFLITCLGLVVFILFVSKRLSNIILPLTISLVICLGLSMFQILPTLEFTMYSDRSRGLSLAQSAASSLPPYQLITFFIPFFFGKNSYWGHGDPYLLCFYVGILPLLLSILAIIIRRDKYIYCFIFLLICSTLMSFGRYTPVYGFLHHYLPFFNLFRFPSNFMIFSVFSLSILAGIGLNEVICFGQKDRDKIFSCFKSFLCPFSIIVIIGFIILCFSKNYLCCWISLQNYIDILNSYKTTIVFLCMSIILIGLRINNKINLLAFKSLIIGIAFLDLFLFGTSITPTTSETLFTVKPDNVKFFEQKDYFRVIMTPQTKMLNQRSGKSLLDASRKFYNTLYPNTCQMWGIFDAGGYGGLKINRYMKLLSTIYEDPQFTKSKLLNLFNVRYLLSFEKLTEMELVKRQMSEDINIYENKGCLPRCFVVYKSIIVKESNEIIKLLQDKDFNPRQTVILEEAGRRSQVINHKSNVVSDIPQIIKYTANKVTIKAYLNEDGYLVLLDTYYPGWNVFIDGEQGRILRANYIFRAVPLEKGNHKIEFIYQPLSFKIGLYVTLITIIILIVFVLRQARNKGK